MSGGRGDLRLVMPRPRDEVGRSVPDRRMRAMDQPAELPTREVLDHIVSARFLRPSTALRRELKRRVFAALCEKTLTTSPLENAGLLLPRFGVN
jgi:hypothetical protein